MFPRLVMRQGADNYLLQLLMRQGKNANYGVIKSVPRTCQKFHAELIMRQFRWLQLLQGQTNFIHNK